MSEPDFRMRSDLPDRVDPNATFGAWRKLCVAAEEARCEFVRLTIVDDEYPNEAVPDGLYVEGWLFRPEQQPPFTWPEGV